MVSRGRKTWAVPGGWVGEWVGGWVWVGGCGWVGVGGSVSMSMSPSSIHTPFSVYDYLFIHFIYLFFYLSPHYLLSDIAVFPLPFYPFHI